MSSHTWSIACCRVIPVRTAARLRMPPYPEGTLRVALFADPAGNIFGIWQETSGSPGQR